MEKKIFDILEGDGDRDGEGEGEQEVETKDENKKHHQEYKPEYDSKNSGNKKGTKETDNDNVNDNDNDTVNDNDNEKKYVSESTNTRGSYDIIIILPFPFNVLGGVPYYHGEEARYLHRPFVSGCVKEVRRDLGSRIPYLLSLHLIARF